MFMDCFDPHAHFWKLLFEPQAEGMSARHDVFGSRNETHTGFPLAFSRRCIQRVISG